MFLPLGADVKPALLWGLSRECWCGGITGKGPALFAAPASERAGP